MRLLLSLLLLALTLAAQSRLTGETGVHSNSMAEANRAADPSPRGSAYGVSVAALVGASAADLASSWGRPELNPVLALRGQNPRFGWQSAVVKLGITVTTLLIQRTILRRRPDLHKELAVSNFLAAGAMGGVAIRNQAIGVPRSP